MANVEYGSTYIRLTSIFSRLDAKRKLSVHSHAPVISDEDEEEEHGEAVINDTVFDELRDHVMVSVQPNHPIYYERESTRESANA